MWTGGCNNKTICKVCLSEIEGGSNWDGFNCYRCSLLNMRDDEIRCCSRCFLCVCSGGRVFHDTHDIGLDEERCKWDTVETRTNLM